MWVNCEKCGKSYDDARCWTICPHPSLDRHISEYNKPDRKSWVNPKNYKGPIENTIQEVVLGVNAMRVLSYLEQAMRDWLLETKGISDVRVVREVSMHDLSKHHFGIQFVVEVHFELEGKKKLRALAQGDDVLYAVNSHTLDTVEEIIGRLQKTKLEFQDSYIISVEE